MTHHHRHIAKCLRACEVFATWHDAYEFCKAKGWTTDEADFDAKVQEAEEQVQEDEEACRRSERFYR